MKKGSPFLVPFHDFQVDKNQQETDSNNHTIVVRRPWHGKREMVHFGPLQKRVKKGWKRGTKWGTQRSQNRVCKNGQKKGQKRVKVLSGNVALLARFDFDRYMFAQTRFFKSGHFCQNLKIWVKKWWKTIIFDTIFGGSDPPITGYAMGLWWWHVVSIQSPVIGKSWWNRDQ